MVDQCRRDWSVGPAPKRHRYVPYIAGIDDQPHTKLARTIAVLTLAGDIAWRSVRELSRLRSSG